MFIRLSGWPFGIETKKQHRFLGFKADSNSSKIGLRMRKIKMEIKNNRKSIKMKNQSQQQEESVRNLITMHSVNSL